MKVKQCTDPTLVELKDMVLRESVEASSQGEGGMPIWKGHCVLPMFVIWAYSKYPHHIGCSEFSMKGKLSPHFVGP